MSDAEKNISQLEAQAPARSSEAFGKARARMLAAGQSVLHAEQGAIYRVSPGGKATLVMHIDPPVRIKKGSKIKLR